MPITFLDNLRKEVAELEKQQLALVQEAIKVYPPGSVVRQRAAQDPMSIYVGPTNDQLRTKQFQLQLHSEKLNVRDPRESLNEAKLALAQAKSTISSPEWFSTFKEMGIDLSRETQQLNEIEKFTQEVERISTKDISGAEEFVGKARNLAGNVLAFTNVLKDKISFIQTGAGKGVESKKRGLTKIVSKITSEISKGAEKVAEQIIRPVFQPVGEALAKGAKQVVKPVLETAVKEGERVAKQAGDAFEEAVKDVRVALKESFGEVQKIVNPREKVVPEIKIEPEITIRSGPPISRVLELRQKQKQERIFEGSRPIAGVSYQREGEPPVFVRF